MGREPAVARVLRAAVLRNGPQPIEHPPPRHPRCEPQQRPGEGIAGECEPGEDRDLRDRDRHRKRSRRRLGQRHEQQLQVLPSRHPEGIAPQLATPRRLGDRIAHVQVHVGLGRPELLAVVGHVAAAVGLQRNEARCPDQPRADHVVESTVAEQQPVRGLVREDAVQGECPALQDERDGPGDRVMQRECQDHHAERLSPERHDVRRVPNAVNPIELGAEVTDRTARRPEPIRREHIGERGGVGPHGGRGVGPTGRCPRVDICARHAAMLRPWIERSQGVIHRLRRAASPTQTRRR